MSARCGASSSGSDCGTDRLATLGRAVPGIRVHGFDERRGDGRDEVGGHAVERDNGVISWERRECARGDFIDALGDSTVSALLEVEVSRGRAAGRVAKRRASTLAFVHHLVQNTLIPSEEEVGMVSVSGGISHRVHERLGGVHRLGAVRIKAGGVKIHLHEDPGKSLGELGVRACSRVWSRREEGDMRLVIDRVSVHAVPA